MSNVYVSATVVTLRAGPEWDLRAPGLRTLGGACGRRSTPHGAWRMVYYDNISVLTLCNISKRVTCLSNTDIMRSMRSIVTS